MLATLNDAVGLAHRFLEAEMFRNYVMQRLRLVVPICCLILFVSVAGAAGVMLALGEMSRALVLVGLILLPIIVVGSLFVQAYLFFSWLEIRALHHRGGAAPAGLSLGELPKVPWILAGAVVFLPLALLALVAWKAALVLVALTVLAPFLYLSLDR
jgi:hypothetical protein